MAKPKKTLDEMIREHRGRVLTYDQFYREGSYNHEMLTTELVYADRVAKQEILNWFGELVGEEKHKAICKPKNNFCGCDYLYLYHNLLRGRILEKLKQEGWKSE